MQISKDITGKELTSLFNQWIKNVDELFHYINEWNSIETQFLSRFKSRSKLLQSKNRLINYSDILGKYFERKKEYLIRLNKIDRSFSSFIHPSS